MGNLSCFSCLKLEDECSFEPALKQHQALANKHSATTRVLMVDGSVLCFTKRVRVLSLIVKHPHHFVCLLDERELLKRPGLHSLRRLMPNEELQAGRLYVLLPFPAKDPGTEQASESGRMYGVRAKARDAKGCTRCGNYAKSGCPRSGRSAWAPSLAAIRESDDFRYARLRRSSS